MTIVRATVVATIVLFSTIALATDAPITGKKLTLRDTPSPRLVAR